jgi:hypothetical protein
MAGQRNLVELQPVDNHLRVSGRTTINSAKYRQITGQGSS